MAENKRLSMGSRVATPVIPSSRSQTPSTSSSMSMEATLARSIGAKIRVQTNSAPSRSVTGYIFAASPSSAFLTLTPAPIAYLTSTAPFTFRPTAYTSVTLNSIQSFTLLELAPNTNSIPRALAAVDVAAVQNRLQTTLDKLQAQEARIGKNVSKEAQDIFDAFAKTMDTRWDDQRIVVLDAVVISPPYGVNDCRAGKGAGSQVLPRIKKVLETERKKLAAGNGSLPRAASGIEQKKGG